MRAPKVFTGIILLAGIFISLDAGATCSPTYRGSAWTATQVTPGYTGACHYGPGVGYVLRDKPVPVSGPWRLEGNSYLCRIEWGGTAQTCVFGGG